MSSPIRLLPLDERPRERCLKLGPRGLSLRECLTLILGAGPPGLGALGVASTLMDKLGAGLEGEAQERAFFMSLENNTLGPIPGLGPASLARLQASFELGRRYAVWRETSRRRPTSRSSLPELAHEALEQVPSQLRSEPHEWLGFVPVYQTKKVGQLCLVEKGLRTHVNTDPIEFFARVLALRPYGFFLFHNHPSGSPEPSGPDLELTRQVGQTGQALGIRLLGHWIVSPIGERWLDFVL